MYLDLFSLILVFKCTADGQYSGQKIYISRIYAKHGSSWPESRKIIPAHYTHHILNSISIEYILYIVHNIVLTAFRKLHILNSDDIDILLMKPRIFIALR